MSIQHVAIHSKGFSAVNSTDLFAHILEIYLRNYCLDTSIIVKVRQVQIIDIVIK